MTARPRPLTPAEIALHALDWHACRLSGLASATIEACGEDRSACAPLRRMMALELLRLSVVLGAAEQRIAGRVR